jgi:hypothetical protein
MQPQTPQLAGLSQPLSAAEVRARVNAIQQVMQAVMKKETHYGVIPGTGNKPTLLKAGSEVLLTTFRLAVEPIVEDLSTEDEARYRVLTRITTFDGTFVGSGIGEATSDEEKYKWRAAVCKEEFDATPEDRRRSKWQKGWQDKPPRQIQQVRMNIADVRNTVLKMAKKRSQIDACLTVLGASDIFTQDIEDMPEEYRNQGGQQQQPSGNGSAGGPQRKSQGNGGAQAQQPARGNDGEVTITGVCGAPRDTDKGIWFKVGDKQAFAPHGTDLRGATEGVTATFRAKQLKTSKGAEYYKVIAVVPQEQKKAAAEQEEVGEAFDSLFSEGEVQ